MRWFYLLCCILLFKLSIIGQNKGSMPNIWSENWFSGGLNIEVHENWQISLEEQFRVKYIDEKFDRTFSEFQIERHYPSYNGKKSFGFAYRYMFINDDDGNDQSIENHQRFAYYLAQKFQFQRFGFKYRLQYQKRRELLPRTNKHVSDFRKYWRIKTDFSYNFKNWKLDPKISTELFLKSIKHTPSHHNKFRVAIGTKYKLNKKHDFIIKYLFEKQLKSWNPNVIHAISLKYNFNLKYPNQKNNIEANEK